MQGLPVAVLAVQVVIMRDYIRPGMVKKAAGWHCSKICRDILLASLTGSVSLSALRQGRDEVADQAEIRLFVFP